MNTRSALLAFASVAALGGCASRIPPVEVTRFHLSGDIARGTAVAAPASNGNVVGLEQSTYETAVGRELSRVGFAPGDTGSARYTFTANVLRDSRAALARRSPISIGIGGGTGGYGGGVGGGVSFGLGGNRSRTTTVTELSVQLRERSTGSVVWEGRAQTEAPSNAPAAQPGLAAEKLAAALFRDFPGESGRTIRVP